MTYTLQALYTTEDGPCMATERKHNLPSVAAAKQQAQQLRATGMRIDSLEVVDEDGEIVHYWERPELEAELEELRG